MLLIALVGVRIVKSIAITYKMNWIERIVYYFH